MTRKIKEKTLELELSFDNDKNCWFIYSTGGAGIPASNFEITMWKEIVSLRGQLAYMRDRNNHLREMVAILNKECNEK